MIDFAVHHGAQLILGSSLLLLLGLLIAQVHRHPAQRHAWAESVLWALPVCAVLQVIPMHRPLEPDEWDSLGAGFARAELAMPESGAADGEGTAISSSEGGPAGTPLYFWVFGIGAAIQLLHLSCGALFLVGIVRSGPDRRLCPGGHGLRVIVSPRARRPFCLGTRTFGIVVLPPALAIPESRHLLNAVLAHEQAHLRSGHGRARLLAAALSPLLYWNPLFWLLVARMRADAELCADDEAASALGKGPYVRALLTLVDQAPRRLQTPLPLMGALAPARPFLARMETLMARPTPLDLAPTRGRRAATLTAALMAVALVNAACGTTSIGSPPATMERISVPFEALSLDGSELGAALDASLLTDSLAPFPDRVTALDGKAIVIEGYLIPLAFEGNEVSDFMLLRDNLQCCMGGAPKWGHWLRATADGSTTGMTEPGKRVRVEGQFELSHPKDQAPQDYVQEVYQLRNWSVSPIE